MLFLYENHNSIGNDTRSNIHLKLFCLKDISFDGSKENLPFSSVDPGIDVVNSITSDAKCVKCHLELQMYKTLQHVVSVEFSSLILHGTFRDLFVLP